MYTAYYKNSASLIKTDENANLIWAKSYWMPGSYMSFLKILPANNSSGYILGNMKGIILSKVDSSGNIIWAKRIYRDSSTIAHNFIKTFDNNLLISATDTDNVILIKTDTLGNIIWNKSYYNITEAQSNMSKVIELPDHSFSIIATIVDYEPPYYQVMPYALIFNTDATGNINWSKALGYRSDYPVYNGYVSGNDIFYASDKSYIVSVWKGIYGMYSGGSIGIAKLDSLGNLTYALPAWTQANIITISENPTGQLNIAEMGGMTGDILTLIDPLLIKSNLTLTSFQAVHYYPLGAPVCYPSHNFIFYNAHQIADKRFIFTGYTNVMCSGPKEGISILLTDSTGNKDCITQNQQFMLNQDTSLQTHAVVLMMDSLINIQTITINDSLIPLSNCNCDSLPIADFSFTISGDTVTFTNLSTNASSYTWYFGDSQYSTNVNPVHVYADSLQHTVCLIVRNNCGADRHYDTVFTADTLTTHLDIITSDKKYMIIIPNPANDNITIVIPEKAEIEILNINGQILKTFYCNSTSAIVDLTGMSSGVYIVRVKTKKEIVTRKIIKE